MTDDKFNFDDSFEPEVDSDVVETDGIDEVEESHEDTSKSVQTNKPKKTAGNSSKSNELNFEFEGLEELASTGVVVGEVGMQVSRYEVERIKFTKDSVYRIAVVVSKVFGVKVHYREDFGSYVCLSPKSNVCCNADGLARVKYCFPVVVYDTDREGNIRSNKVENRVLVVGEDQYSDLRTISKVVSGGLAMTDLLVSCKEEKYQKLGFVQAGPAVWREHAKFEKARLKIKEFWQKNLKNLIKSVARTVTESQLLAAGGAVGESSATASIVDFDDVFKDK